VRTSQSKRRRCYYIVYIDDFSRYTEVHFLVTKGAAEITSKFKTFKAAVKNKGYIIRRFRSDNGTGEYNNAKFQKFLTDAGIQYEPAPPFTQHKNGVAERMIRTINSKARCILIDAKLPRFWAEAIRTAKPKLDHLRRFRCTAYKYIPKDQRSDKKPRERSQPCMVLGYVHDTTKIWRLWDFDRNRTAGQSNAQTSSSAKIRTASKRKTKWKITISSFQKSLMTSKLPDERPMHSELRRPIEGGMAISTRT
jgi:hypothetical protein